MVTDASSVARLGSAASRHPDRWRYEAVSSERHVTSRGFAALLDPDDLLRPGMNPSTVGPPRRNGADAARSDGVRVLVVPSADTEADRRWAETVAEAIQNHATGLPGLMVLTGQVHTLAGTVQTDSGLRTVDDLLVTAVSNLPPGSWVVFTDDGAAAPVRNPEDGGGAAVPSLPEVLARRLPAGYHVAAPAGVVRVSSDGPLISGLAGDAELASQSFHAGDLYESDPAFGFVEFMGRANPRGLGNELRLRGEPEGGDPGRTGPSRRLPPSPRVLRAALWRALRPEADEPQPAPDVGLQRDRKAANGRLPRQHGPNLFGFYQDKLARDFLKDVDYPHLLAHPDEVPDFLEKISLTNPAPAPKALRPEALRAAPEKVSRAVWEFGERRWAPQDEGLLPSELKAPNLRHSIWLGGPLTDPDGRSNLAATAAQLGDKGAVVLWTDVTREQVEQAELDRGDPRFDAIRDMMRWATEHRILVVNVAEVFHRDKPMLNAAAFWAEMTPQRGYAYAAASNILRFEILYRFGGMYLDHDNATTGHLLSDFVDVLRKESGYAFHGRLEDDPSVLAGTSILMGPAGHRAWLRYITHIQLRHAIPDREMLTEPGRTLRTTAEDQSYAGNRVAVYRTSGAALLPGFARSIGFESQVDLPMVILPYGSAGTWQGQGGALISQVPYTVRDVLPQVMRVIQVLALRQVQRGDDVYWNQIEPLMALLPVGYQDQARIEVLRFLAVNPRLRTKVRTLTDTTLERGGKSIEFGCPPKLAG